MTDTKYRKSKQTHLKLRTKFLDMYGHKCNCPGCNETNDAFLTLDHVNNDGYERRKNRTNESEYRNAIKEYRPDIYQVLCFNCNFGKNSNYGICPHIEIRGSEDYSKEWGFESVVKTCVQCGKDYEILDRYANSSKYCSIQCSRRAKKKRYKTSHHIDKPKSIKQVSNKISKPKAIKVKVPKPKVVKFNPVVPHFRFCINCHRLYYITTEKLAKSKYCSNIKCGRAMKRDSEDSIK